MIKFYLFTFFNLIRGMILKIVPLFKKGVLFVFILLYFHVKCLLGLINWESGILFEYHFFFLC